MCGGSADLDAGLWQVDFESHLLPHEDVRVAGLGKQRLQDVELRSGERRPFATLLPGRR